MCVGEKKLSHLYLAALHALHIRVCVEPCRIETPCFGEKPLDVVLVGVLPEVDFVKEALDGVKLLKAVLVVGVDVAVGTKLCKLILTVGLLCFLYRFGAVFDRRFFPPLSHVL